MANGHPGRAVQIGGQGVSTGSPPHGFPKGSDGFPEVRNGSGRGPGGVLDFCVFGVGFVQGPGAPQGSKMEEKGY